MKRTQYLTLAIAFAVVPAIACHRNRPENEPGGVSTSTRGGEVVSDTAMNRDTTGVGTGTGVATDTVTAKGDTLSGGQRNPAGVSGADTTGMRSDTTGGGAGQISTDTSATGQGTNPYTGDVTSKGDTLKGGQRNPAGVSGADTTGMKSDTTKPPR